ncbi:MAG: S1C family serine protease [Burkholderiaceae bacterium]
MKRDAVFSKSRRSMENGALASEPNRPTLDPAGPGPTPALAATAAATSPQSRFLALKKLTVRSDWAAMFLLGVLASLLGMGVFSNAFEYRRVLTQKDIDAAVLHTLNSKELPSSSSKAAAAVEGAVVRVVALAEDPKNKDTEIEGDVGTGVVIKDDGTILTNLHVVASAKKLRVIFFDGTEAEAMVIAAQPEKDLAVLKPQKIPDDLEAAVLGSSQQLLPGDMVVAVGFPYGIGPSVSTGVVSGLNRHFKSPDGQQMLKGLIQFDAAANPGNSGGPLVNASGEVVGIVTAILNPTSARTFIGIGFATTIESAGNAVGLPPF